VKVWMDDKGNLYYSKALADEKSQGGCAVECEVNTEPPPEHPVVWFWNAGNSSRPELGFQYKNGGIVTQEYLGMPFRGKTFDTWDEALSWRIEGLSEGSKLRTELRSLQAHTRGISMDSHKVAYRNRYVHLWEFWGDFLGRTPSGGE
jgi:hypothetical protein